MRKYIIIGPQGSGKGTQARMLAKDFDLVHISVGEIFRWHVQSLTKLGTKVQRYMREGRLVPDEMVSDVVKWRLDIHDWRVGFVLDGFPRNAAPSPPSRTTTSTRSSPSICPRKRRSRACRAGASARAAASATT